MSVFLHDLLFAESNTLRRNQIQEHDASRSLDAALSQCVVISGDAFVYDPLLYFWWETIFRQHLHEKKIACSKPFVEL